MSAMTPDSPQRVHAFVDDALGDHDAVGLAEEIRSGRVSRREVVGDGADRRTDDGLVQRREEHAEEQPRQDGQDLGVGVLAGFRARAGCRFGRAGPCCGRGRQGDLPRGCPVIDRYGPTVPD